MRYWFIALCIVVSSLSAQERVVDSNTNAWVMYFGDHPVTDNWGVHLEGQWRRHNGFSDWQQLLLRPAVNRRLSDDVMLSAGYGFVNTHPYGDFPALERFPEHRIFEQVTVRNRVSKALTLNHRYRLEQRFIGAPAVNFENASVERDWRYENRFRYMLRGVIPLASDGEWYLALYDEIFVNFGKNVGANVFDQNRAYAALGRRAGKWGNVEGGYMHQLVHHRSGRVLESNHTIQVAWFSNRPLR